MQATQTETSLTHFKADLNSLPFPPDMLIGIAAGVEDPVDVAARFGYTEQEFKTLQNTRAFKQALARVAELMDQTGLSPEFIELNILQEMTAKVTKTVFSMLATGDLDPADAAKLAAILYRREEALAERARKTLGQNETADDERFVINITLPDNCVPTSATAATKDDASAVKIEFGQPKKQAKTAPEPLPTIDNLEELTAYTTVPEA